MRGIAWLLAMFTGFGLLVSFSTSQEPGEKRPQGESLESKLNDLRKMRLEENEKELKRMVDVYYGGPGRFGGVSGRPPHTFIVELLRERLRAVLESTDQGKKREDLLVPFLALVKETEAKYMKADKPGGQDYLYMYRDVIIETEIELVKAKIAANRR